MPAKKMNKTVAFFEVRDGHELPFAAQDWQAHLRTLADREIRQGMTSLRHEIFGLRHYAKCYTHAGARSLVVARERDEPPSSLDEGSGEILDEMTQANRPWVEIGVASFISGTNIFGFVLGGMTAPRSGVIADWLNTDAQLFGEVVTVQPYVTDNLVDMVQDGSAEARMVNVRLDSGQIYGQEVDGAGLFSATQRIGKELDLGPEVDVEVILRIRGRSDGTTEGTRRILADRARELIGRPVRGAQVELVDFEPDTTTEKQLVDLVKHRMATKETILVMDDEGHQIRIPSAVDAISRAASRLRITD